MTRVWIRVYCNEPSHSRKVALLAALTDGGMASVGFGTTDGVVLVNEEPRNVTDVFGTSTSPPDFAVDWRDVRHRDAITCPLCGLRWERRREHVVEISKKLAAAGVSEISLRALVATL